jgi:hypothetical protein
MSTTYNGGFALAIAIFFALLLVLVLVNWGASLRLLHQGGLGKKPIRDSLAAALLGLKVTLLYFSGASRGDLRNDSLGYVAAKELSETYFFKNKARCIWQLFTYYMFYTMVLVFLAKPIDAATSEAQGKLIAFVVSKDAPAQILNLIILAATNVTTDFLSLAVTFVLLGKVIDALKSKRFYEALYFALVDVAISTLLFIVSQLVSNLLYPLAITNPPQDYDPFSIKAALMPYAFLRKASDAGAQFFDFTFPGQLFITGTVFIPTLISLSVVILVTILLYVGETIKRIQSSILRTDDVVAALGPEPVAGQEPPLLGREARCFAFAIQSMMATITGTLSTVLGAIIMYLFFKTS